MSSASKKVFVIAELVEIILLDDAITLKQLFVLQRLERTVKGAIEGSKRLQRKMFLLHGSSPALRDTKGKGSLTFPNCAQGLWNPLNGPIAVDGPDPSNTSQQLSIFHLFGLYSHVRSLWEDDERSKDSLYLQTRAATSPPKRSEALCRLQEALGRG